MLWLCALLFASAASAAVTVHGDEQGIDLTPEVRWLEDASRSLTVDQVRTQREGWSTPQTLAPGFSRAVWWVRLALDNPGDAERRLVLDLRQPLQDYVHWYVFDADGRLRFDQASGDRVAFDQRPLPHRSLALPLTLAPNSTQELLLRLDTHDGLFEPLTPRLYESSRFHGASEHETLLNGLYFGAMLALTLYNLLLWVSTRERGFALYVGYAACFFTWGITYRGYGFEMLWPGAPDFDNQILAIAAPASLSAVGLFTAHYLKLRERAPRWQAGAIYALAGLNVGAIAFAVADHYATAFTWCIPVGLLQLVVHMSICFGQWRRGSREARIYAIAFVPLAAGAAVKLLQLAGVIPAQPWHDAIWQIGSALEMLVLALGLADSMNQMKAQKVAAERQAREVQAQLAAGLEQQVRERTLALEDANRRLAELSITDALTGAFNRRHFDERCAEMLRAQRRAGGAIALCMLDVDHFKAYNDRQGHQAGDAALRAIAEAIRSRLHRAGDQLFRLGGEEFGVLLESPTAEVAGVFGEQLRLAVRSIGLPHPASPIGVVTASFGIVCWSGAALEGLDAETLYAEADALLYAAKSAGRDRVIARPGRGRQPGPAGAQKVWRIPSSYASEFSPATAGGGKATV